MLTELKSNRTNEIPWACYHPHPMKTFDMGWEEENNSILYIPRNCPDFEGVISFVDRQGRTLRFSRIGRAERFHEYVLASMIGEWILTGKRVLDLDNLSTRARIKSLCREISPIGGAELEQAVYGRDKDYWWIGWFIKAYTEFQYQTTPVSLMTARNLRFYEWKEDPGCGDYFEVHHVLPKCEFADYETDLRNLIKIPKPVHQLLHKVYDGINNGEEPGAAFCERWMGAALCEVESENVVDLPRGFFEDIYNEWFERRTDTSVIRQQITRGIGIDQYSKRNRFYVIMRNNDGAWVGKVYFLPKDTHLPRWLHQDSATIANMCAYIYADRIGAALRSV